MSDEKNYRYRFTVPRNDDVVNEWMRSQANPGFSLRVLIKNFVRTYGNVDATCVELGSAVKRRGRPPKHLVAQMSQLDGRYVPDEDDDGYYEDEGSEQAIVRQAAKEAKAEPVVKAAEKPTGGQSSKSTDTDPLMDAFKGNNSVSTDNGSLPVGDDGKVDLDKLIQG